MKKFAKKYSILFFFENSKKSKYDGYTLNYVEYFEGSFSYVSRDKFGARPQARALTWPKKDDVDTADGDKVVGTASDEKGAKSIISTSQLPPMKIKDKKTLKIVKVKKKQMIGQPIKEEDEKKPDNRPDSAKEVDAGREDKKKTRIAQLQLQIAKATETINKLNTQEK